MPAKEMVRLDLPHLITPSARPSRHGAHPARYRSSVAILYALLSAGGRARRRRNDRRRRWKPFPRFQCRNRGGFHRPLPSQSGRRHRAAIQAADPHVGHRLLLREHGAIGREARLNCSWRRPASRVFRKLGRRSHRSRHETGSLPHGTRQIHCLHRVLSWTNSGRAFAHRQ